MDGAEGPDARRLPSSGKKTKRDRNDFREEYILLVLSVVTGILAGLGVVCFRIAIEWSHAALLGPAMAGHSVLLILVPSATGLAIAVLVLRVFPSARTSGVNQTKAALYIYNGELPLRSATGKFITSSLAIGSGHSLGPEDPSLHIGAAIGAWLGRMARLSREKLRLIAPIGAAAGLGAAFNTPISAVLFVIEEITGRWTARILGAGMLAAAASVIVARWLLEPAPLFHVPAAVVAGPAELLAYAGIGVGGGLAAVVFSAAIVFLRVRLRALPKWTQYLQPAVAGLLIGLVGYFGAPQVMGVGYDVVDAAMRGRFVWEMLAVLAGLKILATTLSITSGTPGGLFAPTLFIGAMLGGALGGAEQALFPELAATMGANALVGMGALFAGFLRAPITSVFMAVELSGNYSVIVPAMIASTLSYLVSRALQPVPIFDALSRQDGLELPSMEREREAVTLRVEDAMIPPRAVFAESETVAQALRGLDKAGDENALVRDPVAGWRIIGKAVLQVLAEHGDGDAPLASVCREGKAPCLYPDTPLDSVLHHVYAWPILPVLHRANAANLEGVLTLESVLRKYDPKRRIA